LDKELLKRAKAIHDRLVRNRPEARTPPMEPMAEPAPAVKRLKNEPRYVPQAAAPVGAAPEPTPLPEAARTMEPDVAKPKPQPRRHRIDLLACDEPRPNRKPSGLDFPEENERGRRLGKWGWMCW
jgi:hypothetical protein